MALPGFAFEKQWAKWTCGVSLLGHFVSDSYAMENSTYERHVAEFGSLEAYKQFVFKQIEREGTGYVMVGYVTTEICAQADEYFGKTFKEVFRSEKRTNNNSRREFYFVIYDARSKLDGNS